MVALKELFQEIAEIDNTVIGHVYHRSNQGHLIGVETHVICTYESGMVMCTGVAAWESSRKFQECYTQGFFMQVDHKPHLTLHTGGAV